MHERALDGVKVVEIAEGVSGPFCGRILAGMGAEVVKIERPPGGDRSRREAPFLPGVAEPESSALFLHLNSSKKSVTLDWRSAEARPVFERLLPAAHLLIENSPPGTLECHGLGFDALHSTHPTLSVVSITDFGSFGPYADWIATPLVDLALGGYLYLSGEEDREPLMLPGFQPDYVAGLHGYLGATLALWSLDETGEGRHVEVSAVESLASMSQFTTVMHTYSNVVRRRHGNRWESEGGYARHPITVLPCKDGHVSFSVAIEPQWEMLCAMIGRPDMLEDSRYPTFDDRRKHADEIDAILTAWLEDKTKQEVFDMAAGIWSVPTARVSDVAEVLDDPQYRSRGLWSEVDHPVAGKYTQPTVPYQMRGTPPSFGRAPMLGEHNDEILRDRLGFDW